MGEEWLNGKFSELKAQRATMNSSKLNTIKLEVLDFFKPSKQRNLNNKLFWLKHIRMKMWSNEYLEEYKTA